MTSLSAQIRDYDICFAEFLEPSGNGQKFIQAILLREAFRRFAQPLASSISAIATSLRDRSDQIAKIGLTPAWEDTAARGPLAWKCGMTCSPKRRRVWSTSSC
jgi:hypothetical protein